jgi:hypothetical protein
VFTGLVTTTDIIGWKERFEVVEDNSRTPCSGQGFRKNIGVVWALLGVLEAVAF